MRLSGARQAHGRDSPGRRRSWTCRASCRATVTPIWASTSWRAIARLPVAQRAVVVLHHYAGYPSTRSRRSSAPRPRRFDPDCAWRWLDCAPSSCDDRLAATVGRRPRAAGSFGARVASGGCRDRAGRGPRARGHRPRSGDRAGRASVRPWCRRSPPWPHWSCLSALIVLTVGGGSSRSSPPVPSRARGPIRRSRAQTAPSARRVLRRSRSAATPQGSRSRSTASPSRSASQPSCMPRRQPTPPRF